MDMNGTPSNDASDTETTQWRGFYHRKLRGHEFESVVPWHEVITSMEVHQ
jgi:hypothetical protein